MYKESDISQKIDGEANLAAAMDASTGLAKSRRNMVRFKDNPFIEVASDNTKSRARRKNVSNAKGDRMMVVNQDDGQFLGEAGFWQYEEVDASQFVKLFINGVKALKELSGAGTKVFEVLYIRVQQSIGKDTLSLHFLEIDQAVTPMARSTFNSGMTELLKKGFIAESLTPFKYFLNPDFLWNGDRLAFVKEYRLKRTTSSPKDQIAREELEAKGQQRLSDMQ